MNFEACQFIYATSIPVTKATTSPPAEVVPTTLNSDPEGQYSKPRPTYLSCIISRREHMKNVYSPYCCFIIHDACDLSFSFPLAYHCAKLAIHSGCILNLSFSFPLAYHCANLAIHSGCILNGSFQILLNTQSTTVPAPGKYLANNCAFILIFKVGLTYGILCMALIVTLL